jgi:hypothetical protein
MKSLSVSYKVYGLRDSISLSLYERWFRVKKTNIIIGFERAGFELLSHVAHSVGHPPPLSPGIYYDEATLAIGVGRGAPARSTRLIPSRWLIDISLRRIRLHDVTHTTI